MKVLALEIDVPGHEPEQFQPYLLEEARQVWELQQKDLIRETYFRADQRNAVLVLECSGAEEAESILQTLPLVREGLIRFDLIPLVPYPGFARLFDTLDQGYADA